MKRDDVSSGGGRCVVPQPRPRFVERGLRNVVTLREKCGETLVGRESIWHNVPAREDANELRLLRTYGVRTYVRYRRGLWYLPMQSEPWYVPMRLDPHRLQTLK
jgi:hypothetical protein